MTGDLSGDDLPAPERLRRLVEASRHRWHAAPGDGRLFVLDDGTGDVELRLEPAGDAVHAVLTRLDEEIERFEAPLLSGRPDDQQSEAFHTWLDGAVERHVPSLAREAGKGRTRFIVSFDAAQLAGLRAAAEREGVPVAELVRRAVDQYLSPPGA